ncbi:Histidine phosphatase superfamily (branch 1), putative [Angomonas deanei]|uniref:Histidine phosphatase superfamily (Branch 1), putative n=1 Tax=Angomonas deanei TaxID=59799 RepID=A0A7G2CA18_9TRYP|nr:Histidine phosphatase superfamily (branch 1), putative [Angomonas deanei]
MASVAQRVIVMRHGERRDHTPDAAPEGDPPLTPSGIEDVAKIVPALKSAYDEEKLAYLQIYTSPYRRCVQTALALQKCGVGSKLRMIVENSIGEVYGPIRIKTKEPPILKEQGAIGVQPKWGENLAQATSRYVTAFVDIANKQVHDRDSTSSTSVPKATVNRVTQDTNSKTDSLVKGGNDAIIVTHGDMLNSVLQAFYPSRTVYEAEFLSFLVMKRATIQSKVFSLDSAFLVNWITDGADDHPVDPDAPVQPSEFDYFDDGAEYRDEDSLSPTDGDASQEKGTGKNEMDSTVPKNASEGSNRIRQPNGTPLLPSLFPEDLPGQHVTSSHHDRVHDTESTASYHLHPSQLYHTSRNSISIKVSIVIRCLLLLSQWLSIAAWRSKLDGLIYSLVVSVVEIVFIVLVCIAPQHGKVRSFLSAVEQLQKQKSPPHSLQVTDIAVADESFHDEEEHTHSLHGDTRARESVAQYHNPPRNKCVSVLLFCVRHIAATVIRMLFMFLLSLLFGCIRSKFTMSLSFSAIFHHGFSFFVYFLFFLGSIGRGVFDEVRMKQ